MNTLNKKPGSRRVSNMKGFSLVELMIALALGSMVTAGVVQLFSANSETHNLLIGQSRMQESGRFALDFIGRDIRKAGYRGCFSGGTSLVITLADEDFLPYEFDLREGIRGYNATGLNAWNPSLNVLPNTDADFPNTNALNTVFKTTYGYGAGAGIDITEIVSGTDVVTLRHLSQNDARVGGYIDPLSSNIVYGTMPTSSEDIVVGVPEGWAEFDLDHIVMAHDCEKAAMFRVTTSNPWGRNADGSPAPVPDNSDLIVDMRDLTVGHDINDTDRTANTILDLTAVNTFEVDAAVSAILTNIYFIAPGEGFNNVGNNPLSLWRKSGLEPPVELVEGVENLQLLYGEDTDEDGVPNQYLQANVVGDWSNIVTVRVTVITNSVDSVGATAATTHGCTIQDCIVDEDYDGLIRRAYTQTIQMRNDV
jgi:type IV pilus assembly protein PilW